jgi:hypothetical protein
MAEAFSAQAEVVAALLATGDASAAARLQRCAEVRRARRRGDGWPWTCRSAGCAWCRRALVLRWWRGLRRWVEQDGAPVSLAVLPLGHEPGRLRAAVSRLRRACRDVRDRAARRSGRWRGVVMAGLVTGGGVALVLVGHAGFGRAEVGDMLRKRWPEVAVGDPAAALPSWIMSADDAAELARARRGAEPLRVVVAAQRGARPDSVGGDAQAWTGPLPVVVL